MASEARHTVVGQNILIRAVVGGVLQNSCVLGRNETQRNHALRKKMLLPKTSHQRMTVIKAKVVEYVIIIVGDQYLLLSSLLLKDEPARGQSTRRRGCAVHGLQMLPVLKFP